MAPTLIYSWLFYITLGQWFIYNFYYITQIIGIVIDPIKNVIFFIPISNVFFFYTNKIEVQLFTQAHKQLPSRYVQKKKKKIENVTIKIIGQICDFLYLYLVKKFKYW